MYGGYTPFHENFDIGITTSRAIMNYGHGYAPVECGGKTEHENGNGSLMRILPACLYLYEKQKKVCTSEDEAIYQLHNLSSLTHAHLRSCIAFGIYYFLVKAILDEKGKSLADCLQKGMDAAFAYYRRSTPLTEYGELEQYRRLSDLQVLKQLPDEEIRSSGYVVHTLEAAVWCLLTTDSYAEAVLKSINLGDDTDTVGAVTGGLVGLYYGMDGIPVEWASAIQKKDWIMSLLEKS